MMFLHAPQLMRSPLGNSRPWSYDEFHASACMTQHGNQGVDAKAVNPASDEIANAGLTDPKEGGGLGLGQTTSLDHFAELDHEIRTQLEVLGLLRREAEITKHIASGPTTFSGHRAS
jgi:hypothetical protein